MRKLILWDFDGTLASRPGMWSGCLLEILDEANPRHSLRREDFSPYMRRDFP